LIVVDTSALMAILLAEPEAAACMAALESADRLLISAGTLAEALIVARRRRLGDLLDRLVAELGFEIAPVTPASARRVAAAYDKWGKGSHPAALNFGDCFAYELAQARACPLLWVGDDFARTDVTRVI
jgi:ribonuclease VapC